MPPTTFIPGIPKIAIVFAKLMINGKNHGLHPFLVTICNEHGMSAGVSSRRLPPRSDTSPLDYAVTTFNNVLLPPSSFLGNSEALPKDPKATLYQYMWRVPVGAMALSVSVTVAMKFVATIGSDYSYRRHVQGTNSTPIPIISFRTQQLPVLYATAVSAVLEAWVPHAIGHVMSTDLGPASQNGAAVVFKATVCRILTALAPIVAERLGAQGTFGHNLLSQLEVRFHPFIFFFKNPF